jgi:hypothetical protein
MNITLYSEKKYESIIKQNSDKLDKDVLNNIKTKLPNSTANYLLTGGSVDDEGYLFWNEVKEYKNCTLDIKLYCFEDCFVLTIYRTDYKFVNYDKLKTDPVCLVEYELNKDLLDGSPESRYFECLEYIAPYIYDLCVLIIKEYH